jgi:TRAP-type C4-dicarboxylate transport system substrate-binding protein
MKIGINKTWFKFGWWTFFIFLILFVHPFSPAQAGPSEFTVKFAAIAPEGSCWMDFANKIKGYVENRSRGRVKVIWYLAGVMGDEPEVVEKIQAGQLQGAVLTVTGLGKIHPAIRILSLPFFLQNYHEVDYILDSMFPEFKRLFDEKGFVLLGFTEVGFPHLFTCSEPVRTVQDLSRLKMWSWKGEDLIEAALKDLGFDNIRTTSLYETKGALEKGLVNAFYVPCYAGLGLQWYSHAKYISDFTLGYTSSAFVIDKKFFQGLPGDVQNIIQQASDFMMKPLRMIIREEEEKACQGMIRRGIKVSKPSPEFISELKKRSQEIYFKYADQKYPRDLLQKIIDQLEEYRSNKSQNR